MGRIKQFTRQQDLSGTLEHVFEYFRRPENLRYLTPPAQLFEILTPSPVPMHVGARIDYRLRVFGLALRWTSEITEYTPPHGFVDVQRRGPYGHWQHRHRFVQLSPDVVRMTDTVDYSLPWWPLSELGAAWWVERQLHAIFEYRREAVARLVCTAPASPLST